MQMMFQMETHYFLSLFQWLGPWGAAKACSSAALGAARGCHSLSREMPVDPGGSQDCFYSSTICLTKGDVGYMVGGMCWTYTLKVSISPVRLILSIRLASTFSLSFSSNCWETKQQGDQVSNLK